MNKLKLEKPPIPTPQATIVERRSPSKTLSSAVPRQKPSGAITYTLSNGADVWPRGSHRTGKTD